MNKLAVLFVAAICLVISSCSYFSLESKINRLADKVEKNGSDLSADEWENILDEFSDLVDEYYDNIDSYKPSQKKDINAAIVRFSAAAAHAGCGEVVDEIQDILDELPGKINNLIDDAKGFLDGLKF